MNNSVKQITAAVLGFTAVFVIGFMGSLAFAQSFARGYVSDDSGLQPGMAVSLSASSRADEPRVERAAPETIEQVIGVTATADDNIVTIGSGEQEVYVQSSGMVETFASDINGEIKQGDSVTVSPLKGILMLAGEGEPSIGLALEDFNAANAETQSIITGEGVRTVQIAKVEISLNNVVLANQQIAIGDSRLAQTDSTLERLGQAVAGKPVGELQVIIALVIFLVVMIAEGGIIYGAVSSSITSIGRNPMARQFIRSELIRVLLLAIVVLLVGVASIYAVLNI